MGVVQVFLLLRYRQRVTFSSLHALSPSLPFFKRLLAVHFSSAFQGVATIRLVLFLDTTALLGNFCLYFPHQLLLLGFS